MPVKTHLCSKELSAKKDRKEGKREKVQQSRRKIKTKPRNHRKVYNVGKRTAADNKSLFSDTDRLTTQTQYENLAL